MEAADCLGVFFLKAAHKLLRVAYVTQFRIQKRIILQKKLKRFLFHFTFIIFIIFRQQLLYSIVGEAI